MTERSPNERFVNALRTREEPVRVVGAGAASQMTVRVQAAEAWDAVRVIAAPESVVGSVKREAMRALMPEVDDVDGYVVKLGGAEVDERQSLAGAGAKDGSTLLVVSRRRRPVR